MAGSESFHDGDQLGTTTTTAAATNTSFSQLLFATDDDASNDMSHLFDFSSVNSSKMLCFGSEFQTQTQILLQPTTTTTPQTSGLTCSDNSSSVTQIASNATLNVNTKFNRKRNESVQGGGGQCNKSNVAKTTAAANQRSTKKTKLETNSTSSTGHAKVRKEKLGERINALQQLVSPFGKTDTASVLHEAMGYIRFLQDQVQVLCSPYLQHLPVEEGENVGEEKVKDLRSRGLCLVPVDCTMHVASSNGADYWSPATMGNFSSTKP